MCPLWRVIQIQYRWTNEINGNIELIDFNAEQNYGKFEKGKQGIFPKNNGVVRDHIHTSTKA